MPSVAGPFPRTIRQAATVIAIAASAGLSPQSPPPSGLIVGQVVDAASGKPITGAIVRIIGLQQARPSSPVIADASLGRAPAPAILTGSDGRFVFRDLPAGNYSITAAKHGYTDRAYGKRRPDGLSVPLTLADGERTADPVLLLWKHATISGTVVDEAGEPVVRAQVRAWRRVFSRGRHTLAAGFVTTTDDRGFYRLTGVLPGDYIVGVPSPQLPGSRAVVGPPGMHVVETYGRRAVGEAPFISGRGGAVPPLPIDGRHMVYPMTFYPSVSESPTQRSRLSPRATSAPGLTCSCSLFQPPECPARSRAMMALPLACACSSWRLETTNLLRNIRWSPQLMGKVSSFFRRFPQANTCCGSARRCW